MSIAFFYDNALFNAMQMSARYMLPWMVFLVTREATLERSSKMLSVIDEAITAKGSDFDSLALIKREREHRIELIAI
jgi:hypothetical protein